MAQTGGEVPLAPHTLDPHSGQSQPWGWGAHRGRHTGLRPLVGVCWLLPSTGSVLAFAKSSDRPPRPCGGAAAVRVAPDLLPCRGPQRGEGASQSSLFPGYRQAWPGPPVSLRPGRVGKPQVPGSLNRIWVRECGGTRALGRFPTPGAPSVSPGRRVPGTPPEQRPRRHTAPPAAPGYSTGHYAPLGPPGPHWEHRRPLPQHLPPQSAPSPPSGAPGRPCPSAVPRSPGGTPFPGLPGTPGAAGAGSSQTGEGRGRENRRRRARGKAGGGAARGAGRAWERPPPPPAFERATQGARPGFKSKRPPARPPAFPRRRGQGGAGDPSRPGPCGSGRAPAGGRGVRAGEVGEGPGPQTAGVLSTTDQGGHAPESSSKGWWYSGNWARGLEDFLEEVASKLGLDRPGGQRACSGAATAGVTCGIQ